MKSNHRIFRTSVSTRSLAVLGTCIIAQSSIPPAHATTTIGFDGAGLTDGDPIPQLFASDAQFDGPGFTVSIGRVLTGTPHITVWWIQEGPITFRSDWDGRGSVAQINPPFDTNMSIGLVFMSDQNSAAIVDSFDLDLRSGAGPVDVDWSFTAQGFSASGNWQRTTPGRDTITPVYSGEPDRPGDHFFLFKINAGDPGSFAIDNLMFDEVLVPEPTTVTLLGLGSLALVMGRRWRQDSSYPFSRPVGF